MEKESVLDKAKRVAKEHGGECLSTVWTQRKDKLQWCCAEGHTWTAVYYGIVNGGTWCAECARNKQKQLLLLDAKQRAIARGGKCLSDVYAEYLKWQCEKNHTWQQTYHKFSVHNAWCPTCAKNKTVTHKLSNLDRRAQIKHFNKEIASANPNQSIAQVNIAKAHAVAKLQGGLCLSTEYTTGKSQLRWQCREGHAWNASYSSVIVNKTWCQKCAQVRPHASSRARSNEEGLRLMRQKAFSKNGKCLAKEYAGCNAIYTWQCEQGHTWQAKYNTVVNGGNWCAKCAGIVTDKEVALQQAKDYAIEKGGKCISNRFQSIKGYLTWRCAEGHVWNAPFRATITLKRWCQVCKTNHAHAIAYEEAVQTAIAKGGKCLDTEYKTQKHKMLWSCAEGHEWTASYANIVGNGTWCPKCAPKNRKKQTSYKKHKPKQQIEPPMVVSVPIQMEVPTETAVEAPVKIKESNAWITEDIKCLNLEELEWVKEEGSGYSRMYMPIEWQSKSCKHTWQATYNETVVHQFGCPRCTPQNRM